MPPTVTSDSGIPTARIQHKGSILQAFLAPWTSIRKGKEVTELHLHVQDEAGGAGRILQLDSPEAQELAAFHPEIADLTPAQEADVPAVAADQVTVAPDGTVIIPAPAAPPAYYTPPPAAPPAPAPRLFGRLKD